MRLDSYEIRARYDDQDGPDLPALMRDLMDGDVYVPGMEMVSPEDESAFLIAAIRRRDIHELEVREMKPGTSGWIVPWAVHWGGWLLFRRLCVHGRYTVRAKEGGTASARIERGPCGNYVVDLRRCDKSYLSFGSDEDYSPGRCGAPTLSLPVMVVFRG